MADIFLSYRRQDSQSATGRLADRLEEHFGAARVFRDHESILAGADFAAAIRRAIAASTVLLVIVGPRWLEAADDEGRRRLDAADDFVRLEIELAFADDVAVVPVLVEGATMPAAADLPPSLAAFARCQAIELSETRWRYDSDRLIAALQSRFAIESDAAPPAAGEVGPAARLIDDLAELLLRPTRLISQRQTGRASDNVRALAFLVASIAIGNLALAVGLGASVAQGSTFLLAASSFVSWLLAGELVGLLLAGFLVAMLALAWRLVGGTFAYRHIGLVAAYVYGGTWLGFCAGALLLGSAVQLVDPGLFDRVVAALRAATFGAGSGAVAFGVPSLDGFATAPFRRVSALLVLLAFALWIATVAWAVAAWGAFGQAAGATRGRAVAATALWAALLGALLWIADRLG